MAVNLLAKSDEQLLAECDIHIYKASGPGGQHRNKVSSAVRLKHRPTGISATANDSRSQHDNRRLAMKRLRMNLCLRLRNPVNPAGANAETATEVEIKIPDVVAECLSVPKKKTSSAGRRMNVGRKDSRFWLVGAYLLDWLAGAEGRLAPVATLLGISTGNLTTILKQDRHLLAAAQEIRHAYGQRPIA
ncbi:MAG: peptide chain release factor-like protein [Phycisphaerae bacterium]|nr:peptide chain release factor-like protein [Phycisphaerae bacterium]